MSADVVGRQPSYGLQLADALTGGPLLGPSLVVETTSDATAYLTEDSRWVFEGLKPGVPATFVITARHYIPQTLTTTGLPGGLPHPTAGVPPYLAVVTMMPRTGYPFSPTLTRVVGEVRVNAGLDKTKPPVPLATVTLTPIHFYQPPPPPVPPVVVTDPPVTLTTTDDGQYTFWFFPELGGTQPPIANQLTLTVSATVNGTPLTGNLSLPNLTPNGVTYAPSVYLF